MADTSIDNDMPISEVVTALKKPPQPETPPTTPVPTTPKSPLFEDPDEIVVKRAL